MEKHPELLTYRDGFAEHARVRSRLVLGDRSKSPPLVSILIPTYKRPHLLRESVRSALNQRCNEDFEVVVVDNDSDPNNATAVEEVITEANAPNLILYRNDSNIGMFGNWNRCIELANGQWITILNDDDLLAPDFLSATLSATARMPEIRLIACKTAILEERAVESRSRPLIRRLGRLLRGAVARDHLNEAVAIQIKDYFLANPHHGSLGILFQREAALRLGGFAPELFPSADFIFLVRFQLAYGAYSLGKVLATYRISVNESLNSGVLRGWLHQGLQLRLEIARHINRCPMLLNLYSQIAAIDSVRFYKMHWAVDTDTDALLRDVGLPNVPVYALRHAMRTLLHSLLASSTLTTPRH